MMRKIPLYRSNKCRFIVFLLIAALSFIFLIIVYSCTGTVCFGVADSTPLPFAQTELSLQRIQQKNKFDASILHKVYKLDFESGDILVYLHIQKTGGATFGRHLVHNLAVNSPCRCQKDIKKCECVTSNNHIWLLSRHSTGWVCGLHADWTELNDCVDEWFKNNDLTHRTQRR
ncbi:unnamed protein product [Lymnaea stagnalis]|uniref:Heparan-sulfate 6-O-sulfotransferase n=1 Tax=Lymnaea stagnalis TaxID=6523 RepID=A0AAV2IJB7_LYMST